MYHKLICLPPLTLALLITLCSTVRADFPLKDVAVSDSIDLSGEWLFEMDRENNGANEGWHLKSHDRTKWTTENIPRVWGHDKGKMRYSIWKGRGWYHKKIKIPEDWTERVSICFLGAMYVTDVWVNDTYVGLYRGGFSPFRFDITDMVKNGEEADIVVRVDNRTWSGTVPSDNIGWQHFGGLYREVYLLRQPAVRPENLAVSVKIDEELKAAVNVTFNMTNSTQTPFTNDVSITLADNETVLAQTDLKAESAEGGNVEMSAILNTKEKPRLWTPNDPHLCQLHIEWNSAGKQKMTIPVGLKEIRISGHRILLNNKRIWLQGFGLHEEYMGFGPCVPEKVRRSDLKFMKEVFNCNTIRPGHYPNHPDFYRLCDEMGFLVFTEIPAWQNSKRYMESSSLWRRWLEPQLSGMVESLRNHTCVMGWGISNEIYNIHEYFEKAIKHMETLDPSRPTVPVLAATSDLDANRFGTIVARNFHYGWYHSSEVYALKRAFIDNIASSWGKPVWVSETGGMARRDSLTGGHGDLSKGSETYLNKLLRFSVQYCATESDQIAGITVWTWADFHRDNDLCPHGILSESREPKLAAYTVCNLYNGDLRVFVCEDESMCRRGEQWRGWIRLLNPAEKQHEDLTAKWRIIKKDKEMASGEFEIKVSGERSAKITTVEWYIPNDAQEGMYTFWLEVFDKEGKWIYTNNSFFDVAEASNPGLLRVAARKGTSLIGNAWMLFGGIRVPIYEVTGLIMPLEEGSYDLEFHAPGEEPITKTVTVENGSATDITVDF